MGSQRVLDFGRRDVVATPSNHVLVATGQKDVAVTIDGAGVAGAQPAVAQGLPGDLGGLPVPRHDHRISKAQLTNLAFRGIGAIWSDNAQFIRKGSRDRLPWAPDASPLAARGRALDAAEGILAQPIAGDDPDAKARLERRTLLRIRTGSGVDRAQRRLDPGGLWLRGDEVEHGANHVYRRDVQGARLLPEGRGMKFRRQRESEPVSQRAHQRVGLGIDVEERKARPQTLSLSLRPPLAGEGRGGGQSNPGRK